MLCCQPPSMWTYPPPPLQERGIWKTRASHGLLPEQINIFPLERRPQHSTFPISIPSWRSGLAHTLCNTLRISPIGVDQHHHSWCACKYSDEFYQTPTPLRNGKPDRYDMSWANWNISELLQTWMSWQHKTISSRKSDRNIFSKIIAKFLTISEYFRFHILTDYSKPNRISTINSKTL